jgi:hypothetical protein
MNNFTQEELKNILALVNLAPIKGQDAVTVALLQQKLSGLITPPPVKEEEKHNEVTGTE